MALERGGQQKPEKFIVEETHFNRGETERKESEKRSALATVLVS